MTYTGAHSAHSEEWEPNLAWRFARVSVFCGRMARADAQIPVKQAVYCCWRDHTTPHQTPTLLQILPALSSACMRDSMTSAEAPAPENEQAADTCCRHGPRRASRRR